MYIRFTEEPLMDFSVQLWFRNQTDRDQLLSYALSRMQADPVISALLFRCSATFPEFALRQVKTGFVSDTSEQPLMSEAMSYLTPPTISLDGEALSQLSVGEPGCVCDKSATDSPPESAFRSMVINSAPTFRRGDGMVTITSEDDGFGDIVCGIGIQSDGKIVVAGYSVNESASDFTLMRLRDDGNPDMGFGEDWRVNISAGGLDYGSAIVLQADGKIVMAGYTVRSVADSDFVVVRYDSDGHPDMSFSGDGLLTTSMGSRSDYASTLLVQPDGRIVVAGWTVKNDEGTDSDFAVARYDVDGKLDKSFSADGKTTTSLGTSIAHAYGMALQSDGKIVVAGYTTLGATDSDFALVRYNADGTLDKSFSGDGKVTASVGALHDVARSVAIQSDGKILVAGYAYLSDHDSDFTLLRFNSDGSPDTGFGVSGTVLTPVGLTLDQAWRLLVLQDDLILVAGYVYNGVGWDIALVRYMTDGNLDMTFGIDGKIITTLGASDTSGLDAIVQSDGKIFLATTVTTGTESSIVVMRYNADGSLDRGFDVSDTLGGTVTCAGGGAGVPVLLDSDAQVFDAELDAVDSYGGASLTLERQGGADPHDRFLASGSMGELSDGGTLSIEGRDIGMVTQNSGGRLQLEFEEAATGELINQVMQSIAYANASMTPASEVVIEWVFCDGDAMNPQSAAGTTRVIMTPDSTAPYVIAITPADGATEIPRGALIEVTLSEAVRIGNGTVSLHRDSMDGGLISCRVTVAGSTLTIDPDADLSPTTRYLLSIDEGALADFAGNPLDASESFSFTTASARNRLNGSVTFWNGDTEIAGVALTLAGGGIDPEQTVTTSDGSYQYEAIDDGDFTLQASKAAEMSDNRAVGISDALAALKIALGSAQTVSSCQYLAADVNQNGKVEAGDALDILKMALHLDAAPVAEWIIVSESTGNEPMERDNVTWPDAEIPVTLDQDKEIDLVGVLLGDVNGSWSGV